VEGEAILEEVPSLVVAWKACGSILAELLVLCTEELAVSIGSFALAHGWDCKDFLLVTILAHCCLLKWTHRHGMISVRKQTEQCKRCRRAARSGYAQAALR